MRKEPTDEQWKKLYDAAIAFKEEKPWNDLSDSDMIVVENPAAGEEGYCVVMGAMGEHLALSVNLGSTGLYGLQTLLDHGDQLPFHHLIHTQNSLMASFEDRENLTTKDRNQIKKLGFKFRGRNAWPMFRRMEPGFEAWYLTEKECIFLTHALEQTLWVVNEVKDGKQSAALRGERVFLRKRKHVNGNVEWYTEETGMPVTMAQYWKPAFQDELLVKRIKKAGLMDYDVLEIEWCYAPAGIQKTEKERPFYPRMYLIAEQEGGMVVDFQTFEDAEKAEQALLQTIGSLFVQYGTPKEIHVQTEELAAILEDFCKKLGIYLLKVPELENINRIMEELIGIGY